MPTLKDVKKFVLAIGYKQAEPFFAECHTLHDLELVLVAGGSAFKAGQISMRERSAEVIAKLDARIFELEEKMTHMTYPATAGCTPAVPFNFRSDGEGQVCISAGGPDPAASVIRGSKLTPIAKMRALDVLRQARALGGGLAEDVGTTADEGVALEFAGPGRRELMIAIGADGGWTYFSAATDGRQTKAGILRDDGLLPSILWVAGSRAELAGSGVIAG